jgi:hypothetical protein
MLSLELDGTNTDRKWPNGNYLFALVTHPSGPKGQPDTGTGSKPITTNGLPKACSVSSHCTFIFSRTLAHRAHATRRALTRHSELPRVLTLPSRGLGHSSAVILDMAHAGLLPSRG